MSALTPAQIAVLERIEKKKDLQKRKATKRKAKTEPEPDTTINQDESVVDVQDQKNSSKKRKRIDSKTERNTNAETPNNETQNETVPASDESGQQAQLTTKASSRRRRKTEKFEKDEMSDTPAQTLLDQHSPDIQASERSGKKTPARRGRKTETVDDTEISDANQTLNEAQLNVLNMLKTKEATKKKGRKSTKPSDPVVVSKIVEKSIDIDSGSEKAVTSTVQGTPVRTRRKSIKTEDSSCFAPSVEVGSVSSKRRRQSTAVADVAAVAVGDSQQLVRPSMSSHETLSDDPSEDDGPLNATMIAVMEKLKEKKAKQSTKKSAAKSVTKQKTESSEKMWPEKQGGPLTPNQVSVMKKLQEKKLSKDVSLRVVDSGHHKHPHHQDNEHNEEEEEEEEDDDDDDDDDDQGPGQLTEKQIKDVLRRLEIPINNRERTFVRRLKNEGVYDAIDSGRVLSSEQNALVVKYKTLLEADVCSIPAEPVKHCASSKASEDGAETDVTDEIVAITSKQLCTPEQANSADEFELENEQDTKTYLIFDTNAYLRILPYCRAVLDSERLKDEPDYQHVIMFALFVVIRELDMVSKKKRHLKPPAMAAIRLIHGALQDKNSHIEGQDFASSKEKLADSTLNDDYILNSADLLKKRGETVVVVTDDRNLQVKIAMMRITSLNCLEFISTFHWLTPLITNDIKREALTIGEDVLARFIECVIASVVLKGVLAHLAPLPMERRRELFPSEKLAIVLALMLKNKTVLQAHSGPFGVLNYDRVAQTLNPLQLFDEGDRATPKDERRFQHFARFLFSAEILCRNIASYFPNMESRSELIGVVANYFRVHLPEAERSSLPRADFSRSVAEQPSTSRAEAARRTLLPTKKVAGSATSTKSCVAAPERHEEIGIVDAYSVKSSRSARLTRGQQKEPEDEFLAESEGFSFSQRKQVPQVFQRVSTADNRLKSFSSTPSTATKPIAQKAHPGPYVALQQSISADLMATVYEYFQKFGLSICNYTGSCCVKLGVKFSLAFKVSSARVETSLPEITDSFALVVRAMKNMISGTQPDKFAREFLQHSSELMSTMSRADPELVAALPKVTHEAVLAFSKDPEGKQQLVTGYQQFCDFSNCLEKCWLEAQRS